jgi:N-methylhydantoinase A
MAAILGVDVGGTFTDFFLVDERTGETHIHKAPSTPDDPSRAIIDGIAALSEKAAVTKSVRVLAHGTTVATNALIQRRGGRPALLTTAGFKDLLEIGRQTRPKIYDLKADHPEPLVPRERRLEVAERVDANGIAILPLTDAEIARAVAAIGALDIDCVAVCFLFSFLNSNHEQRVGAALRAAYPHLDVSLSSDVQPEFREYERLSTTVLNTFLQPEVGRYMARLKRSFADVSASARIGICQSSGGLMSVDRAAEMPIRTALSGPAAGVVGAIAVAARAGVGDVVTFDMGGTSTDVCLIQGGRAEMAFGRSVAGFPVRLPSIDIHTVGAGGGSIAHLGRDGLLKVGPQSAGAIPGPACYGQGGTAATVTDANLFLGRLPADLVGGGMRLRIAAAEAAIKEVAHDMRMDARRAALGILRIVNSNMVRAIRAVSVERGYDPRRFALMPFGGAGALHAVDVAREMGITKILVPPAPGILCAEGVAVSDLEESFVATCRTSLAGELATPRSELARLSEAAEAWFIREAVEPDARRSTITVDMRYIGQNYELPIVLADAGALNADTLRRAFFEAHRTKYGHFNPDGAVEIVNVRLVARARLAPHIAPAAFAATASKTAVPVVRDVWFDADEPVKTSFLPRDSLAPNQIIQGPAVITQFDATTLLPPGASLTVLPSGSLSIEVPA